MEDPDGQAQQMSDAMMQLQEQQFANQEAELDEQVPEEEQYMGLFKMSLEDTVEMMKSEDYKERFKAEYYQTKITCKTSCIFYNQPKTIDKTSAL